MSRPQSAMPRAFCPTAPNPAVTIADGLRRSIACQAAPTPWTRFYFPKMEDMSTGNKGNPFYNHFDVIMADVRRNHWSPLHIPWGKGDALNRKILKQSRELWVYVCGGG